MCSDPKAFYEHEEKSYGEKEKAKEIVEHKETDVKVEQGADADADVKHHSQPSLAAPTIPSRDRKFLPKELFLDHAKFCRSHSETCYMCLYT